MIKIEELLRNKSFKMVIGKSNKMYVYKRGQLLDFTVLDSLRLWEVFGPILVFCSIISVPSVMYTIFS